MHVPPTLPLTNVSDQCDTPLFDSFSSFYHLPWILRATKSSSNLWRRRTQWRYRLTLVRTA